MIAEATIREALDATRELLLGDTPQTVVVQLGDHEHETAYVRIAPSVEGLFEACVEAALMAPNHEHIGIDVATQITRAVIQTLIDRTESPTTCAELTRILAGVV